MPVAHVGLSRGPRPFPNGFRTGRTETTPTPPTPPVWLGRSEFVIDNRTTRTVDQRTSHVAQNARHYDADNRTNLIVQS